jgi:putative two-component system response regulator
MIKILDHGHSNEPISHNCGFLYQSDIRKKILVVDDDPNELDISTIILTKAGYRVYVACDGATGLKCAKYGIPDLILLDAMMPDKNGFQVCQELRGDPKTAHIPIIFKTALADVSSIASGFISGTDDYIVKPYDHDLLIERIKLALGRCKQQRANSILSALGASAQEQKL